MVLKYRKKKWLYKKYVDEGMSCNKIANECSVTGVAIHKWLVKHAIPRRNIIDSHKGKGNGSWVDSPIKNKTYLEKLYVKEKLSLRQIARKHNVGSRTVARWMKIYEIKTRDNYSARMMTIKRGKEHPNFIHGMGYKSLKCVSCGTPIYTGCKSCQPCYHKYFRKPRKLNKGYRSILGVIRDWCYEYWRPKIFKRDGYSCQKCGDDQGGNLNAHHIERIESIIKSLTFNMPMKTQKNCEEAVEYLLQHRKIRSLKNGVTLCKPCHINIHKGIRKNVIPV